jgi:hypothetical protein
MDEVSLKGKFGVSRGSGVVFGVVLFAFFVLLDFVFGFNKIFKYSFFVESFVV